MTSALVRFESYAVDFERRCLFGPAGPAELRHKSFEVLRFLLEHAGRVVAKDEVLDAVWPDVTVGDESLTQCISEIRRALGDTEQRIIKTIPRCGYMFAAPVTAAAQAAHQTAAATPLSTISRPKGSRPDARHRGRIVGWRGAVAFGVTLAAILGAALWHPWAPADAAKLSIAVLPFTAESDDEGQAMLADGLSDDLIAGLSKLSGLAVLSRTTAFHYRGTGLSRDELAHRLGVGYVLTARVSRMGKIVTVHTSLWDSRRSDRREETLSREHTEIFELQAALKRRIVATLGVTLSDAERDALQRRPTRSFEAYIAYLDAERHRNIGTWPNHAKAFALYDKALRLDEDFLDAHIGNARAAYRVLRHTWLTAIDPVQARRRLDRSLAKVFALDTHNADGLGLRAQMALWLQKHEHALQVARTATSLHPENPDLRATLAGVLIAADRPEEARIELLRALELAVAPSPELLAALSFHYLVLGDANTAIALATRAEGAGLGVIDAASVLANAYAQIGDLDRARVELERMRKVWPRMSVFWYRLMIAHLRNAHQRERLLAAFRSAGMPEKPYGFEGSPADRLTNAELRALFHARTVRERGTSPGFAWAYETIWGADGSLHYTLRAPTPLYLSGRWQIDGDKVCFRYDAVALGRPYCVHIYRDPDYSEPDGPRYKRADMFGIIRFTAEPLGER